MTANQRAVAGAVMWLVWAALRVPNLHHGAWAQALLLLAALVLVPLALELAVEKNESRTLWWLVAGTRVAQLPAALLLGWAYLRPAGGVTAVLALPWVGVCGMVATTGWLRARRGGWRRPFDRLCGDAAFIFLGVGGAWVFADRGGARPLNFDEAIVMLTAVHFHFAGLLLPLLAGLTVRAFPEARFATRAAVGTLLGVPAVALGITATQLGWGPAVESAAGVGLALAGMAVAILHVRLATDGEAEAARRAMPMTAARRGLFFVAGVSLFFGMALAAAYASRSFAVALPWLDVPWMRAVHGTVNALGFGLCGVLAWRK
ncbi:MAG: YndJ family transporter [Verrucomicrobia bacterium]|nr:YndJ family transporter [Verrucomicrobiota bacterium]